MSVWMTHDGTCGDLRLPLYLRYCKAEIPPADSDVSASTGWVIYPQTVVSLSSSVSKVTVTLVRVTFVLS